MSDPRRPSLFDPPGQEPKPTESSTRRLAQAASGHDSGHDSPSELPLFPEEPAPEGSEERSDSPRHPDPPRPGRGQVEAVREPAARDSVSGQQAAPPREVASSPRASLERRWRAGGFDLLVHLALGLVLLAGSRILGTPLLALENLGAVVFLGVFSFLYTVIPLAFWGQTPGMVRAGLVARSLEGQGGEAGALTFGQTALRWLSGLLTVALLGLPSLLVWVGGRSLADRVSGSQTWQVTR